MKLSDESFGFWRPRASRSLDRDAELLLGIATEVLLDEGGREPIKSGGHRRVGGEEVPGSRDGQRDLERLPGVGHEGPRALQNREARMPFVQMADLRLESQRGKQPPAADPEQQLLLETKLRARRHRARW